jgi:hypothetical protein
MKHPTALLAAFLLAACVPDQATIIDGSSEQAFEATSKQARRDLSVADRLDFDRAMATVPTRRFSATDPNRLRRTTFDGMTAAQVVEDYRRRGNR